MAYRKILVAVDTTEEADEVLAAARQAADRFEAELICLTVIRPLAGIYGGLDMAPVTQGAVAFEEEAMDQARKKLERLASVYHIATEDVHVERGTPAAEIQQSALREQCDLIVMGTHGRHGLGRLLGSTANSVLHGVETDVLVVKITAAS